MTIGSSSDQRSILKGLRPQGLIEIQDAVAQARSHSETHNQKSQPRKTKRPKAGIVRLLNEVHPNSEARKNA